MSHVLVARATSIGASAVLMGGLVLLALTMSYVVQDPDIFGAPPQPVEMAHEPPPPLPPTTAVRPPSTPVDDPFELPLQEPLQDLSSTEPAEPYIGAVETAEPVEISAPHWQRRPTNLTVFYPDRALRRNTEGEVVLNCLVRVSGLLDCSVVSESPAGWGFGEAALRIARAHRMVPATRNGVAVEGRYVMRVPFQIE